MATTKLTDSLSLPASANPAKAAFAIGAVGAIGSLVGLAVNPQQFLYAYLVSFSFCISILLASLFFVMLHHVTRSHWSVTVRRIPETFSSYLWVFAILFIPILIGMEHIYDWTQEQTHFAYANLQEHKEPYLNKPFFVIRNIIYFGIWAFLGWKLYQKSIEMDETGNWGIDTTFRKISAPGIFIFSFAVAFASFDWLMTLRFDWFSTMFGVYFFAMFFQAFFAILLIIGYYLRSKGQLLNTIKPVHLNDASKLLFGFTVFYAYIAFSQYFLIYYATIPEETYWFYNRLNAGNWGYLGALMLFGRFIIPFVVLLGKRAKQNPKAVLSMSVLIIICHYIEFFWIAMPELHSSISFHWIDLFVLLAFSGLTVGLFFYYFSKKSMVPKNDPNLAESLNKH